MAVVKAKKGILFLKIEKEHDDIRTAAAKGEKAVPFAVQEGKSAK
jgi:hypothetical protein